MVPFQFDISKSSPSESPYEHASAGISAADTLVSWENNDLPAPSPFSPFSSSSSRRKFRGTLAPMSARVQLLCCVYAAIEIMCSVARELVLSNEFERYQGASSRKWSIQERLSASM